MPKSIEFLRRLFSGDPMVKSDPEWGPGAPWFVCKWCGGYRGGPDTDKDGHLSTCEWAQAQPLIREGAGG